MDYISNDFANLAENKNFPEKSFADCLLVLPPKDTMLPNFANSYKTSKLAKV